jgi:hypothetical protein
LNIIAGNKIIQMLDYCPGLMTYSVAQPCGSAVNIRMEIGSGNPDEF